MKELPRRKLHAEYKQDDRDGPDVLHARTGCEFYQNSLTIRRISGSLSLEDKAYNENLFASHTVWHASVTTAIFMLALQAIGAEV